ncbi:MAG TPA: type II toxin-antitoxin system RelE/ParE family toxin [Candidatus Binatia bacterium]|nr:type II toxin-antitoxin system RelE/ParE family toxin [Candidatus Binatia bacterium]
MSRAKSEIRLLRAAEEDLTDIIMYIASDRSAAAIKLTDRFNQKLSLLVDNPHLGSMPRDDSLMDLGYRYLIVDNYLVFYTIEDQVVYVHRILHGARDYTQIL